MGLSRRSQMAIEAMVAIACSGGELVSTTMLAERMAVSRRTLEPVLQALARAGLLISTKGPTGGYALALERNRISVQQIVESTESTLEEESDHKPSPLCRGVIDPISKRIRSAEAELLAGIKLSDLRLEAQRLGCAPSYSRPIDYVI
ncbi:MAG TPA: Rrf2 family transcriptional regulator [Xanthobacteraceae bacterium]|nr:Rrf2 family transcriptional regulator [Xanthobacteraceae bacterium]